MKDRIKVVRKNLKMTQTEFGEAIGVKGNTITGYETGLRTPSEAIITAICREFKVNRIWLETGAGEPFRPVSRDEYIAEVLTRAITNNDSARDRLIRAFCQLPDEMYDEAEKILIEVISNLQKEKE